jgi:hypothetical protein
VDSIFDGIVTSYAIDATPAAQITLSASSGGEQAFWASPALPFGDQYVFIV